MFIQDKMVKSVIVADDSPSWIEKYVETLGISKELREKACYDVHESFEKRLAEQIREQAVDFANKIKELLK